MIVQALNRFRDDNAVPIGYARKSNCGFELQIRDDASGCALVELYREEGKKTLPPVTLVPNIQRSGTAPKPMLGCDTAAFVLGRPKQAANEQSQAREDQKAQAKQAAFLALLGDYAAESGDPDALIYQEWVVAGMPGLAQAVARLSSFATKRLDMDLVCIRVEGGGGTLHDKRAAVAFWGERALASKSGGTQGVCLSCGQIRELVDTIPQSLAGSLIPATSTANVALISMNFPAASRGASGLGLKSAPICGPCAVGAVNAFNTLASDREKHRWSLGKDVAAIWWATDDALDDSILCLGRPDPGVVREMLAGVSVGRPLSRQTDRDHRFYFLAFSGNVARLVIRRWLDLSVAEAGTNIQAWFRDIETADPDRPFSSIFGLAQACGVYVPGADPRSPDGVAEALLLTAVAGAPPPRTLLSQAIARTKAESHLLRSDGLEGWKIRQRLAIRVGLFRLVLNRTTLRESPMGPHLDEANEDPAYLSGRLFAVRQAVQYNAMGEVNASIVDRYFSRAMAHPASVDGALTALEEQHLRAIRRKDKRGKEIALRQRLRDLHDRLGAAPGRLSADDQALWIAGYYQQQTADLRAAQERKASNPDNNEPKES